MAKGHCTECGTHITLGKKPRKGQIAICQKCEAQLVVVNLSPIELEWIDDDDAGDSHTVDDVSSTEI